MDRKGFKQILLVHGGKPKEDYQVDGQLSMFPA